MYSLTFRVRVEHNPCPDCKSAQ